MKMRVALLVLLSSLAARAGGISAADYKLYKDYQAALTDARVQKIPEARRLSAIAKNFKVPEARLKAAVAAGDAAGDVGKKAEADLRAALDAALAGRIASVSVDATEGLVVTYVTWKNADAGKLEEEAALVASRVAATAPVTSTISLAAADSSSGANVFQGKIDADNARSIKEDRIPLFAKSRYIKLFDGVKLLR